LGATLSNISVRRLDGVVDVVLDRADKRNALTLQMWNDLLEVLQALARDQGVRVVVLSGAGEAFCAGTDLTDALQASLDQWPGRMRLAADVILSLHRLAAPTIAKVRGPAVGGGCNLALACDLVVASEDATFRQAFIDVALSVDLGGSWILPRLVGLHRAKEFALLGEVLSAAEASSLGLINRVLPREELDDFVSKWTRELASKPALALSQTKQLINLGVASTLEDAVAREGSSQTINFAAGEAHRALSARHKP
jgi:2-(1,2-epoxy-1,2-dihydrophenyl)acetyl-CoA isomerase